MCSNYRPATADKLRFHFNVTPPDSDWKEESYPGYVAPMIRRPRADSVPGDRACALGMFGTVPHWADVKLARQTYNARTETVATKPSFRNAYKRGQFCILPVSSFYEPSYESGKPVRWEIADAGGKPLGIAGIWEHRQDGPNGLPLLSTTNVCTARSRRRPVSSVGTQPSAWLLMRRRSRAKRMRRNV